MVKIGDTGEYSIATRERQRMTSGQWELDPAFHTPGWAERRLKELREEEEMGRATEIKVPIRLVQEEEKQDALLPPLKVRAVLDQDSLEAIRQVVHDELQQADSPDLTAEQKQAFDEWKSLLGQTLAAKVATFYREHPELRIHFSFSSWAVLREK
jgi:hypothetical protein